MDGIIIVVIIIIVVVVIIIVVVVIIIVVVVVEKGKAIKEIKIVSNSSVRESRSRSGPCQRS
jgi:flagellar basal body-associated protein FliL